MKLALKHIELSGREKIYPAHHVEFRPAGWTPESGAQESVQNADRVLAFTEEHYIVAECFGGTVFVMNENGSTVSRYDLGGSMIEPGADARRTRAAIKS